MRALYRGLVGLGLMIGVVGTLQAAAPEATVQSGRLGGVRQGAVEAFLGIPFAAPPTGANRWRAPQPVAVWQGVRPAVNFAANCWQPQTPGGFGPWTHEYVISGPVSEDCLYLNVWTPEHRKGPLPVMVWIHGGGFTGGSGSVPLYDGARLAARGIIVVTINYRLGVFGFLAHPELTREARTAGTPPGNYALQDQVAALQWVRTNIAAFGGNPAAVTIAGQSAGAMSVHALIASPLASGLFRGAIAESGLMTTLPLQPLATAEHDGATFAASLKAPSLAALRVLPPDAFATTGPGMLRFSPITDGVLITGPTPAALNDTPLLTGMNTNDPGSFGPAPAPSADAVSRMLQDSYGPLAARFAPLYPAANAEEQAAALRDIARDRGLGALYAFSRQRLARSHKPLYLYLFSHTEPGPQSALYGAFHSAELAYVFDTLDKAPERGFTAQDRDLARIVSSYWLSFVRDGKLSAKDEPAWPQARGDAPKIMQLDVPPRVRHILPADTLGAMQAYLATGATPRLF